MDKLISVIIPIYNSEKYIKKCIESLINQTYKNIEVILINDGSTDNSEEICNQYASEDGRIKVINTTNKGVSASRNIGLKNATGDYISFIDCDDYIDKDLYLDVITTIKEHKDIDLIKYQFYKVTQKGKIISKSFSSEYGYIELNDKSKILDLTIKKNEFSNCWGLIYKRKVIEDIFFNEELIVAEDYLFVLDVLNRASNIIILEKPYYYYVFNPKSITNEVDAKKILTKLLNHYKVDKYVYDRYIYADNVNSYKDRIENNIFNLSRKLLSKMCAGCKNYTIYISYIKKIQDYDEFKFFYNISEEWKKKYDELMNINQNKFITEKVKEILRIKIKKIIVSIR